MMRMDERLAGWLSTQLPEAEDVRVEGPAARIKILTHMVAAAYPCR